MSVYTTLNQTEFNQLLSQYNVGELLSFQGIPAGIDNTNYFVSTTQGEYVLTLFERIDRNTSDHCLRFVKHLSVSHHTIPAPIETQQQQLLSHIKGKHSTLITRAQGSHPTAPFSLEQLRSLGDAVGRIHKESLVYTTSGDANTQQINRGQPWRAALANEILPRLSQDEQAWLTAEITADQALDTRLLPKSLVHADMFPDNTLFEDQALSGIIDWYFTTYDTLLYDIAITVNAWCTQADGSLNTAQAQAFLQAYHQQRPLQDNEKQAWRTTLRIAGLRFWVSRTYDKLFPRDGELTLIKDPDEYKAIILHRTQAEHLPWIN